MSDTGDELTIAAAARALSAEGDEITRQGLSKYCATHGLTRQTPRGVRVSLAAVRQHRQQNYQREVMSGGVQLAPPASAPAAPANDAAPLLPPATSRPAQGGGAGNVIDLAEAADPSRRLKQLQVEEQELDLAKMRGEVVLADEVTAGVTDIVVMLRQSMFQAIPGAAKELAAELSLAGEDERQIRAAMKAMAREILTAFVASAARANAELSGESASETRARINALAVAAARMRHRPSRYLQALEERAS